MLQEELQKIKAEVDEFLKNFFEEKKQRIGQVHPEVRKMIEDIEDVTLRGGDRFRPFMVYLGWLSGLSSSSSVIPASSFVIPAQAGIQSSSSKQIKNLDSRFRGNDKLQVDLLKIMSCTELLQTFALIHDDIIDNAEIRRGGPTIKPNEKALLAGDLCFVFADELLNGFSSEVKKEYDILREEVIAGEWMDTFYSMQNLNLKMQNDNFKFKIEESVEFAKSDPRESAEGATIICGNPSSLHELLMKIYRYKTVSYTILQPFMMGLAAASGHSERSEESPEGILRLQKILVTIGLAFQIQDDYLDLFGDVRLGKKIGGDLQEGKLTIWHVKIADYFQNNVVNGLDRSLPIKYNKIFGNKSQKQEDIDWIKKLMIDSRVKKEIEQEMQDLAKSAKQEIEKLENINPEAKELLSEMADFVVKREY
jgi:geranylgeranyl diphosphate synthase, type I